MAIYELPRLEAATLSAILNNLVNELGILKGTLLPDQPFNEYYKCPEIRISPHNQNIWKLQHLRVYLVNALNSIIEELQNTTSFTKLAQAAIAVNSRFISLSEADDEFNHLRGSVFSLRDELTTAKETLFDITDPWSKTQFEVNLSNDEEKTRRRCTNKERYFGKFWQAKHEGIMQQINLDKDSIENRRKEITCKTDLENRCSREWESFLTISHIELQAEFDRCVHLQEKLTVEKENKIQSYRIARDQYTEKAERCRELLKKRVKERKKFLKNREVRKKLIGALATIQTWWRAVLETKPKLLKFKLVKKKKKKKKKKGKKKK